MTAHDAQPQECIIGKWRSVIGVQVYGSVMKYWEDGLGLMVSGYLMVTVLEAVR